MTRVENDTFFHARKYRAENLFHCNITTTILYKFLASDVQLIQFKLVQILYHKLQDEEEDDDEEEEDEDGDLSKYDLSEWDDFAPAKKR